MRKTIVWAMAVLLGAGIMACTSNNAAERVDNGVSEAEIARLRAHADSVEALNRQLKAEVERLRLDSAQALLMLQNVDDILADVSNSAWHATQSIQRGRRIVKNSPDAADREFTSAMNDVVAIQNSVGEL